MKVKHRHGPDSGARKILLAAEARSEIDKLCEIWAAVVEKAHQQVVRNQEEITMAQAKTLQVVGWELREFTKFKMKELDVSEQLSKLSTDDLIASLTGRADAKPDSERD